jgi:hypothetical protein
VDGGVEVDLEVEVDVDVGVDVETSKDVLFVLLLLIKWNIKTDYH